MKELNVKVVIISKQGEDSENYKQFLEIVKEKNIKVKVVKAGDKIKIDNNTYLEILWPIGELLQENILNNNSIVAKLTYKNFTSLFSGDIEEIAEKEIIKLYEKTNKLRASLLKVAHHGSKSSSIQDFLDKVKPKIALIGVGENNKFGHPNEGVIQRLENSNCKIYRTDEDGEITVKVDKKEKIWVDKMLE